MRKTMGRYIDGLDDGDRDTLITAPEFNDGHEWRGPGPCGCLIGTVRAAVHGQMQEGWDHWEAMTAWADPKVDQPRFTVPWRYAPASIRYPQAVRRFGLERVVRAIKLRASSADRSARIAAARESASALSVEVAGR